LASLYVARVSPESEPPGNDQLHADHRRRNHEVVDIQHGLNDDDLRDHDVEKEDDEESRRPIVAFNRHQRQPSKWASVVPWGAEG